MSHNLLEDAKDEWRKIYIYRGMEEWYLGRLITSRLRFESGFRNKEQKRGETKRFRLAFVILSFMETWFVLAAVSALFGGLGAFAQKVVAVRNYETLLVVGFSSVVTMVMFVPLALWFEEWNVLTTYFLYVALGIGLVTAIKDVLRIQAFRYIDSMIFLPLTKVLSPLFVISFGVFFFSESFSPQEWLGLIMSSLVPILLVSRMEGARQNNLRMGLLLVVLMSLFAAIGAGLTKFALDIIEVPFWLSVFTALGVFITTMSRYCAKNRGKVRRSISADMSVGLVLVSFLNACLVSVSVLAFLWALILGGPLGIAYTINSLYIIPPIILAIIFYGEHWNLRKVVAILVSILALFLLR